MINGGKEMEFRRARNAEQKDIRRQQIINMTARLLEEIGYEKITFTEIGKCLSFTRINLYHYFANKNDIFLELLLQDIEEMVQDAENTFSEPVKNCEVFIGAWTEMMLRHQRMMAFFSITNTVFLKGATHEVHEAYRIRLHELFQQLERAVRAALPYFSRTAVSLFVEFENSYAMTLYPASMEYKKAQRIEILEKVGFGTGHFSPQFSKYLEIILMGLAEKDKNGA